MSAAQRPLRIRIRERTRGFTMLELMITVAIIAILAALALPSFREFNIRMQVTDLTNDLVHDMNMARAEAAKRGSDVTVEAAGSWGGGWAVKAGAEVISQHEAINSEYAIQAKSSGGGTDGKVAFRPSGGLAGATSFDFNVCRPTSNSDNSQSRRVTVQGSGTVSSRRDVTGSPAGSC